MQGILTTTGGYAFHHTKGTQGVDGLHILYTYCMPVSEVFFHAEHQWCSFPVVFEGWPTLKGTKSPQTWLSRNQEATEMYMVREINSSSKQNGGFHHPKHWRAQPFEKSLRLESYDRTTLVVVSILWNPIGPREFLYIKFKAFADHQNGWNS